jgi:hypothetical protein
MDGQYRKGEEGIRIGEEEGGDFGQWGTFWQGYLGGDLVSSWEKV